MKRLMLIGAGGLGLARARLFANIDGVELVAVASRTQQSAEKVAREVSAPLAGTDHARLADQKNPHAVVICAPNHAHYGLIKWALQRELDVFVDGPMCTTAAQAEELVNLAVQYRRLIEVGFQRRYHPTIQRARQMGLDGSMGQLIHGEVEFLWNMRSHPGQHQWSTRPHPGQHLWYLDQAESGGMFVAHGSYGLNTLRYVLGDPSEVFAAGNNFLWHEPGMVKHDTVAATLMYESGAVARILAGYSMPDGYPTGLLKAHGTSGAFHLQIIDAPYGTFWNDGKTEEVGQLEEFDDLRAQCEAFVRALYGHEDLLNSAMDSWRELRIIEGIIRSAELRTPQAVH